MTTGELNIMKMLMQVLANQKIQMTAASQSVLYMETRDKLRESVDKTKELLSHVEGIMGR